MTLDDAIAILEQESRLAKPYNEHLGKPAMKIGIEALKAIRADRCGDAFLLNVPLPGETEE